MIARFSRHSMIKLFINRSSRRFYSRSPLPRADVDVTNDFEYRRDLSSNKKTKCCSVEASNLPTFSPSINISPRAFDKYLTVESFIFGRGARTLPPHKAPDDCSQKTFPSTSEFLMRASQFLRSTRPDSTRLDEFCGAKLKY
jgi:hypothetical protein